MEKYQEDSYLIEFETKVKKSNDKFIELQDTIFYPNSGGQAHDTGKIISADQTKYNILYVGKFNGIISHEVDKSGLKEGDIVKCLINWQKRHMYMRYHTAMHILSKVIYKDTGAVTCGNQIGHEQSRVDLTLENLSADMVKEWLKKVNQITKKGLDVRTYEMNKKEALQIDDFVRTETNFVDKMDEIIRIVDIKNYDKQACGGTHVKNTDEIGILELVKIKNKGKNNKRIYFTIL
jgi:misacylated tRNA(Ala) deacylase